jgi:membrane protein DedA with SNARE-associated domain
MDWWDDLRDATAVFLDRHGLLAAGAALLIEEAGLPLPFVPGDVLILLLGVRARQGLVPLWQVIAALEAVTLVGASLLYAVCRRAGRDLLHRYGRVLHLTPSRLALAERWAHERGVVAVSAARLVPGFRIATAVVCGVLAVPYRVFLPGLAAGALVTILGFTLLGYALGPPALALVARVHVPLELLGSLLTLAFMGMWIGRARRALQTDPLAQAEARRPGRRTGRLRAGLAAGAVATLASTLLMNVLVHAAGSAAFLAPHALLAATARRLPGAFARHGEPLLLLAAVPAFVAVGLLWGAVYGARVERHVRRWLRLPDWATGLAFATAPLAIGLLILLPLLGLGFPGSDAPLLASVGETVRHAAYGMVLGLTFPIFRTRHLGRAETARGREV